MGEEPAEEVVGQRREPQSPARVMEEVAAVLIPEGTVQVRPVAVSSAIGLGSKLTERPWRSAREATITRKKAWRSAVTRASA